MKYLFANLDLNNTAIANAIGDESAARLLNFFGCDWKPSKKPTHFEQFWRESIQRRATDKILGEVAQERYATISSHVAEYKLDAPSISERETLDRLEFLAQGQSQDAGGNARCAELRGQARLVRERIKARAMQTAERAIRAAAFTLKD